MPPQLTYPGVYIEEIPSGVRTITGVPTSVTAFLGRADRGPADEATTITSFADYQRTFGDLSVTSTMSYAVRDFFLNGGSEAIIVRLFNPQGEERQRRTASSTMGGLVLRAAGPGTWGNNLRIKFDQIGITDRPGDQDNQLAKTFGLDNNADLFNLRVFEKLSDGSNQTVLRDSYLNVSVKESARRIDRVLKKAQSTYVRATVSGSDGGPGQFDNDPKSTGQPFANQGADSDELADADYTPAANQDNENVGGIYGLDRADIFNLLCIPPDRRTGDISSAVYSAAASYCAKHRAMLIVDTPTDWETEDRRMGTGLRNSPRAAVNGLGMSGLDMRNAAVYFPRVRQADPLKKNQEDTFPACGVIAGVMARTDTTRGVWKAPAGLDAGLTGVQDLVVLLTDEENGLLNPVGINCLRNFQPGGKVVWGARTLRGDDQLADEYKYVPVRRTALFIEESLYRGTQWVVFEPNDEPLWAQIRLNIGAFMNQLFRQGAFQGATPREAYFVKCDKETTTQNDINQGIVNILVGFAPLKPAEFVVIKIQQIAGQIET